MKQADRCDQLTYWSDSKASILCDIDSSIHIRLPNLVVVWNESIAHADDTHPNNPISHSYLVQLLFKGLKAGSSEA